MKTKIDLQNWNRREHFDFFNSFEEPFFGLCSEIDCTEMVHNAKTSGQSLFLRYLHASMKAINSIPEFRRRIEGDSVFEYSCVHASVTIGREDHTFGYCFLPWFEDYDDFAKAAEKPVSIVRNGSGLGLDPANQRNDVIHCSSIPWVSFTGFRHARKLSFPDSVPKIIFGRTHETQPDSRQIMLPVSLDAHHGLADGYHAGLFFQRFQEFSLCSAMQR
ncbi:MAG: chloramphenicol acetyltransferase [Candidatus Wallbacteria bacterium HGW-Wallbacteria-1]|jgi:chloramphenicol O-acetyltransferase type A|uniref:Chloramphenicol acetyltransferase n=1 Tax=Candidatus Wallbacteria bacterium HGW-Wallbacteria-1 TaxID=2013854 RepID=A0A2N1PIX9_9BACT|nr:MAG: chloramphenicol acetyltransferase [Candidatus Wallbacteria bacterium HGW-Wallbacteria-1]